MCRLSLRKLRKERDGRINRVNKGEITGSKSANGGTALRRSYTNI